MKLHAGSILALALVVSCAPKPSQSSVEEAPDFWNALTTFGFNRVFTYNDLHTKLDIATPDVPWSDTYWPLAYKGLAWRYAAPDDPAAAKEEVQLAAFIRHYADESAKTNPDPLLSPAEKYDMVFQYRHGLTAKPDSLQALVKDLAAQDALIKAKTDIKDKRPMLRGLINSLSRTDAQPALSMTLAGWSTFLQESSGDKNKYLAVDANPGDDWSWEGHCHGWAPAAVMSRPPKHGVMAKIGDKQVFFSEGDLRGLMTKAWADSAPDQQQYFLARRCEESPQDPNAAISANAAGKGYSGTLKRSGKDQHFVVLETYPQMTSVGSGSNPSQLNIYRIKLDETGEKLVLVERARDQAYWTTPYLSDLVDAVRSNNFDKLVSAEANLTGCWDPNPASFHAVLVEQLDERKIGFVMDRTRTGQVWNQPIYAANFEMGPLVPVGATTDAARAYRASGTAFLVEVKAVVTWNSEPGSPAFQYSDSFDDDQLTSSEYHYTLEFDAHYHMIGGEWGTLARMDASSHAPDFLFGFAKGSVPVDNFNNGGKAARIDYSGVISRLHDCSVDDAVDGSLKIGTDDLPYKTCIITQLK